MVVDERILMKREKVLVVVGIGGGDKGEGVKDEDVRVMGMKVRKGLNGDEMKEEIEEGGRKGGRKGEYMINDEGEKVRNGVGKCGIGEEIEMSDGMGRMLKKVYGKEGDLIGFRKVLGEVRVEYEVREKGLVVGGKMRRMGRLMKMW